MLARLVCERGTVSLCITSQACASSTASPNSSSHSLDLPPPPIPPHPPLLAAPTPSPPSPAYSVSHPSIPTHEPRRKTRDWEMQS
ncbi:uncharacterized protein UHOD_11618 [Ustilago sp. UG-2017b]|nr:uncharacterized protein UHOD_11618 [Ustilago sp. UG-2017b]